MSDPSPDVNPPPARPSPVLVLFLVFPVLGIIAALGMALANRAAPPIPTPLPAALPTETSLIDQPAPNFELTGLDGRAYRLSSYRGRVVFVNFWATWCEPCQRELPAFQQFVEQQGADGAVILAVNVLETPDQINPFLDANGVRGLTVLLDSNLVAYDLYAIDRMPTTYVVDPAGVVRYKHLGEMTLDDLNAYTEGLQP